uniref:Ig-like domain-containing protein n=1 Tax=Equus asinus TaxID=9793 RepID=A0A8C4M061_EQUAS
MKRQLGALLGLLWVQVFCELGALNVEQSPSALSLQEGTSSTLRCNFSATVNYVQWFRQNPGSGLINLFFMTSEMKQNGRLNSTINPKELYSNLHITDSRLGDSATYLCAVRHSAPRWSAACTQTAAGPAAPPLPWGAHVAPTAAFAHLWVFRFMFCTFFPPKSQPFRTVISFFFSLPFLLPEIPLQVKSSNMDQLKQLRKMLISVSF